MPRSSRALHAGPRRPLGWNSGGARPVGASAKLARPICQLPIAPARCSKSQSTAGLALVSWLLMKPRILFHPLVALLPLLGLFSACTASQESAEERPASVPTTIRTDADRQAAYNSGAGYGGAVPDATPGRVPLGEQASGINSRKRPESLN